MPKNLIVCADGTGNKGGSTPSSNVYKIYKAVNPTTQVTGKRIPLPIAFFCEISRHGGYVAGPIQSIQEPSLHQTPLAEALFSIIA